MKKEKQKKYEPVKVLDMENRLIAEFMGMEESNGEYYRRIYNSGDWIPVNDLEFKTSWDWLIPVVDTIFKRIDTRDSFCFHKNLAQIKEGYTTCSLRDTYSAVIHFIIEYNKNPYPFTEGEGYWTIEGGVIVHSYWDWVSEDVHDENPDRKYFRSREEAKIGLIKQEVLDTLYWLEDKHDYKDTPTGEKIGKLINKIQNK